MGVKFQGNMYCDSCQRPVAGQKSTHRLRNAAAALTAPVTGGASVFGAKAGKWHCPHCGGPAKPLPPEWLTRVEKWTRIPRPPGQRTGPPDSSSRMSAVRTRWSARPSHRPDGGARTETTRCVRSCRRVLTGKKGSYIGFVRWEWSLPRISPIRSATVQRITATLGKTHSNVRELPDQQLERPRKPIPSR